MLKFSLFANCDLFCLFYFHNFETLFIDLHTIKKYIHAFTILFCFCFQFYFLFFFNFHAGSNVQVPQKLMHVEQQNKKVKHIGPSQLILSFMLWPRPKLKLTKYWIFIWLFSVEWNFYFIHLLIFDLKSRNSLLFDFFLFFFSL